MRCLRPQCLVPLYLFHTPCFTLSNTNTPYAWATLNHSALLEVSHSWATCSQCFLGQGCLPYLHSHWSVQQINIEYHMPGTLQVPWELLRIYYPFPSGIQLSIVKIRHVLITRLQGGKGQTHTSTRRESFLPISLLSPSSESSVPSQDI